MLTSREHQQVAGVPHRFMHFWFWSSILLHKCRSAGSGATSFFTSAEVLRATVPAVARVVLSPLILLQDDDFFNKKEMTTWSREERRTRDSEQAGHAEYFDYVCLLVFVTASFDKHFVHLML